uniref:Uncharacterized protein n=1 Tax=Anguilla anguilla TaxID=7936 RepID=A0A0E9WB93_ANGAN
MESSHLRGAWNGGGAETGMGRMISGSSISRTRVGKQTAMFVGRASLSLARHRNGITSTEWEVGGVLAE